MSRPLQLLLLAAALLAFTPASPGRPTWHVLEAPEFTVVSAGSEKDTRAWASEFHQFIGSLNKLVHFDPARLPPLTVVIFDSKSGFDPFRPLDPRGRPEDIGGMFTRNGSGSVIGLPPAYADEATREVIFHEGVHWCVSSYDEPVPLWFNEGLAEVFSTFQASKGTVQWGRAIDRHVILLHRDRSLPLEKLLFVTADSPLYYEEHRMGIFYAESWAFVHYIIFGQHAGLSDPLKAYFHGMESGAHPDAVFQAAFGGSYKDYDEKLWAYLNSGRYIVAHIPAVPETATPPPFRPAAAWEVEDALAKLALGAQRMNLARQHADAALLAGPDRPEVYEVATDVASVDGQPEQILASAQKAIAHGSRDSWIYFLAARERYQIANNRGSVSPEDARRICNDYERAINRRHSLREAYANLGGALGAVNQVSDEDRKFLALGHRLFPDEALIDVGLAEVDYFSGKHELALHEIEELLPASAKAPLETQQYIAHMHEAWKWNLHMESLNTWMEAGRFADVVAGIDVWIAENPPISVRLSLESMRSQANMQLKLAEAKAALEAGDRGRAKQFYQELLDMRGVPPFVRSQIETQLAHL